MKLRHFLPLTGALLLAACDQNSSESQRLADERAALEREKAALAADKAAAQQAANEQERARLDAERAALQSERTKLTGDREAAAEAARMAKLADERAKRETAERKAADEAAARREAEMREREARENAARAAEDARNAQTVDFFYDALDPHGDWVETDRYGYAFRPRAARDARWRPYTDGAWVHTEYGWTWRSNEPFGWATYHYGRWARVPRLGWVWVPGSEWGPAWVSWRRSDEYIGWAPLPPDAWSSRGFDAAVDAYFDIGPGLYAFVRVRDFVEPTYVGRVVEPERNTTIINQTVNVTKVTYQTVQNHVTVVNQGPDITLINQRAARPVPQLQVQRLNAGAPQPAKVQGGVLQMLAPFLKSAPAAKKPAQVKEQVKAAEFEHGWKDAKADAAKFRAAAQQEARKAEEEQRKPQRAATPAPVAKAPAATPRPATPAARPATPIARPMTPLKRPSTPSKAPGNSPETPSTPSKAPGNSPETPSTPSKAPGNSPETPSTPSKASGEPPKTPSTPSAEAPLRPEAAQKRGKGASEGLPTPKKGAKPGKAPTLPPAAEPKAPEATPPLPTPAAATPSTGGFQPPGAKAGKRAGKPGKAPAGSPTPAPKRTE